MNTKQKVYFIFLVGGFVSLFILFVVSVAKEDARRQAADALIPRATATDGTVFRIKNVNGCEYLEWGYGSGYSLCHKGDCTNSFHRQ